MVALSAAIIALAAPLVSAQSTGSIAQGFTIDTGKGEVVAGSLVSLKPGSRSVELATSSSVEQLIGVIDQNPLVVISEGSQEAQVVLGGTTNALVSDINGAIKAGDRITASPVAGVGMLADTNTRVIGITQNSFDAGKGKTQTIKDSQGKMHTIHVGYVQVQISLSNYQAPGSNFLPPFIQSLANSIAGRQVSIIRVLVCSVLLLMSFLSLGVFIFSSARSAMTSIGRNPLASDDVRKSLYQVAVITIAAWGGALLACYLILTL